MTDVSRFVMSAMVAISDVAVVAQCALQRPETNMDTASAQKRTNLLIIGRIANIFANETNRPDNGFVVNF